MQTEGLLSLAADMAHAQLTGCAKKRGTEYFDGLGDVLTMPCRQRTCNGVSHASNADKSGPLHLLLYKSLPPRSYSLRSPPGGTLVIPIWWSEPDYFPSDIPPPLTSKSAIQTP